MSKPCEAAAIKMTTYGYETTIVPSGFGLARKLTQVARPRPLSAPKPKHNGYFVRPDRALTVWQIVNPIDKDTSRSLHALAALVAEQAASREKKEARRERVLSAEEIADEKRLFAQQAEILGKLQWEDPSEFFDSIDTDRNGKLNISELRQGLIRRGLSEKMAEPIVRDLDVDDDGQISRDEFTAGFYSSRLCTVPTPQNEDFSDLRTEAEAGCYIKEPEHRAITLRQLAGLRKHIIRRCNEERWRNFQRVSLSPGTVTMYDAARYIIRPATFPRQCSFVELVAIRAQRPKWCVSHWWGTRFYDLVSSLGAHARDRFGTKMLEVNYWVCAFAINHWNLGERDPLSSGFFRALKNVEGTVLILDRKGAVLSRVWCTYESYAATARGDEHLFDVYTALDGGRGVGFTDGKVGSDGPAPGGKTNRESKFPLDLAQRLCEVTIETGETSLDSDRTRILNRVAGCTKEELNNPPAKMSPGYSQLNNNLRTRLVRASINRCLSEQSSNYQVTSRLMASLGAGKLRTLDLSFDNCPSFTETVAKQFADALPQSIVNLSLRLRGHGDAFIQRLGESYRHNRELLSTLRSLDLGGNAIGNKRITFKEQSHGVGVRELCIAASTGFLKKLDTLRLDSNLIDDIDMNTLCNALTNSFESISFLALEANQIGEPGMGKLMKALENPYGPPLLERLALTGNVAPEYVIEAVQRQLAKRGNSARNMFKQNFGA